MLEVYIYDIRVKTLEGEITTKLQDVLELVRKYNMHLNPAKYSLIMQAAKFLGFMLTKRGI